MWLKIVKCLLIPFSSSAKKKMISFYLFYFFFKPWLYPLKDKFEIQLLTVQIPFQI